MTFESSSAAIVLLAWERSLALPEGTLLEGSGRITHAVDSPSLTFVRLWERSILTGPEHLINAANSLADDELSDHAEMLRLTRDDGGRGLGTSALYYADDLDLHQPENTVHVSTDPEAAAALAALCPPDDVNDAALSSREQLFTVMESEKPDAGPLASCGWREEQGLLAQLGTLVAPASRRQGWGTLATSITAHEALAAGLIVQWRADINNASAHALATSLGISVAGLQTQVSLQAPQSPRK